MGLGSSVPGFTAPGHVEGGYEAGVVGGRTEVESRKRERQRNRTSRGRDQETYRLRKSWTGEVGGHENFVTRSCHGPSLFGGVL